MSELTALFQRLDWLSVLDIALVATIFFVVLYLVRGTPAVPLLRGLLIMVLVVTVLGNTLTLPAFNWLFRTALPALLIAIPVIFQPELRRALERVGRAGQLLTPPARRHASGLDQTLNIVSQTCQRLADRKTGALIVFERNTGLQSYADTGVRIDSVVTSELLQTIFYRNTPLHDGAVIVRDNRILAAACILPLTTSYMSDRRMGLRHRAGIGITEATDAVAVVVSEEHGTISIAHNGRIIRRLDAQRLETVLRAFYQLDRRRGPSPVTRWVRRALGIRPPVEVKPSAAPHQSTDRLS